jgi:nucleotide-binding universal stress UspA family protein
MYDLVLVPTDGSDGSAHAALRAVDLADQYGATVHALHVVSDDFRSLVGEGGRDLDDRGARAVGTVERMARAHGVDAVTAVKEGDPADTILAYAGEAGADLVVAGTHGRSGIERRLIGSVAERLVRHASCPVLTVRLPDSDETVADADHAAALARAALEAEGYEPAVTGTSRQNHLWVVEAEARSDGRTEGDPTDLLVYVDPVTQRTSTVTRTSGE